MKSFGLILQFIFLCCTCFSQDTEIIHIDSLPAEGFLLDKGWKFQPGDNPEYAKPDYDDSEWEEIDLTKDIYDLPQISKSGQIGWFRIRLAVDTSITQQLVLMIEQSGASEIYLNGNMIHRFGVISKIPEQVRAFNPGNLPSSFQVNKGAVQLLSVRYALQPGISYGTHFGNQNMALKIIINTTEHAVVNYTNGHTSFYSGNYLLRSVFGLISLLFFTLFIFFPSRKYNLYFAIYSFLMAISWILFLQRDLPDQVGSKYLIDNSVLGLQAIGYLFMLTAVYHTLEQKRGWPYWFIVALGIISIPSGAFIYGWGWLVFGLVFTNLINIEIARIALIALQKNKKGAWIIVTGGICFLFSWIIFSLQFFGIYTIDIGINFFNVSLLSIPIAFAIFLGYDFALTNRSLEQKLTEIQVLSAEKHQLLITQNATLERQVGERTAELQRSLETLQATQAQLIQSGKMASLGELTAGIAHEIQNPLNFVNNFSEVNKELLIDLNEEIEKRNYNEVKAIAKDVIENEQKINHHGKRADAIVKGMLQHSRSSNGQKEPTDINAIADEFLRLSYHGLRAKDKSFNATIKTDFDQSIKKINVVSQDIGRVLLSLFTNAFYSVNEKKKQLNGTFEPIVSVSSQQVNDQLIIKVKDNGTGIPETLLNKIYQPFFTTKPTGEGTGLGLSMSYDIIKAHGGEMKVESKEGEGAEFIIELPVI